ncbi:MAG: hypothetical protein IKT39_02400 [Clostridia bacterium]|nr:hypothetical protein [Clostridia bacterium]
MRVGANIKLTVPGKSNIEVGGGGTKDHAKLKHLGFDESGHAGFQKELTPEQLAAIASILSLQNDKEDKSNKKTSFSTSGIYDEESYPTVGAVAKAIVNEAIYTENLINSKIGESIQSAILDSWEVAV